MAARRAHLGRVLALVHIPAVAALPFDLLVALEHLVRLDACEQSPVPGLMLGLDFRDEAERRGNGRESLLVGHPRELGVELGPLFVLARGRSRQVLPRRRYDAGRIAGRNLDHAAFQKLEETFGMLLFLIGRLEKDACDLFEAFLLGHAGEERVARARLRFTGERLEQILLGLGSFDTFSHLALSFK